MSKALIRMLDRPNLKHHSRRGRFFRVLSLELHNRMEKPSSGKLVGRQLIRLTSLLAPLAVVILACSGLPAIKAAARNADTSVGTLVEAINSRYGAVRTLKTEFTQTYVWGDTTKKESGTAYFARGGLMRWEYQQPKDKLVVADGKKMWLYIPQEKQVTQSPFKPQDDPRVPFPLLLSHFDLRKVFSKVELAPHALKAAPGNRVLRGYPRHGLEDLYSQVLIEVTPHYDIQRLVVFYPDRSVMEFAFDHMQTNLVLSPALFTFVPPAGSEVINQ